MLKRGLLLILVVSALGDPADPPVLTHGVASGDVTAGAAVIWARASSSSKLESEYSLDPDFRRARKGPSQEVTEESDFTGQLMLTGLRPETRYHYRIVARDDTGVSPPETGSFRTAPRTGDRRNVRFLWAGDLGGQGHCRTAERGYEIFAAMTRLAPDFVLFSGDMIYADVSCPTPPNLPGSGFVASTLVDFRRRWKYNREDPHHKKFLASTSMVTQWDDHEVTNDFAGPFESLMPAGRQAYFEYHPMTRFPEERHRLYRKFRWGKEMELFVLDNRQYQAANTEADSATKSMLGPQQFQWLVQSLAQSKAVWKIIATSVPLTVATGTNWQTRGRDGWASGNMTTGAATGWERELLEIFKRIRSRKIANVIWITTDVHFAQIASLDPFDEGKPFTYEFISGPLSAVSLKPVPLDTTLRPTRLYGEGEFYNFGQISIDARTHQLTVEILGQTSLRYTLRLEATP